VVLPLFAVRDDRRARGFEPLDGVSNGNFVERIEAGIFAVASCDPLDEIDRPWDAADRLGGYDRPRRGHAQLGLCRMYRDEANRESPHGPGPLAGSAMSSRCICSRSSLAGGLGSGFLEDRFGIDGDLDIVADDHATAVQGAVPETLFQIRNSRYRISSMVWIAPSGRTSPTPTVMIRFRYAYLSVEVSNLGSVRK
jgi:hypothetical protein